MRSFPKSSIRFATLAALGSLAAASPAVISTTSLGSNVVDSLFSGVGAIRNAGNGLQGSGVAVGPRSILTVRHTQTSLTSTFRQTIGNVTTSYGIASMTNAPSYSYMEGGVAKSTPVDLVLLTLTSDLPTGTWYDVANAVGPDRFTMAGYGRTGVVNGAGDGYTVDATSAGKRRTGVNDVDFGTTVQAAGSTGGAITAGGPNLFSFLDEAGDGALGDRDSGGGWFQNNDLFAISAATFNFSADDDDSSTPAKYADYGFGSANTAGYTFFDGTFRPAGSAYFASSAIDLTDPQIQSFLIANGVTPVPEPASLAALGLGALAALRRRKRR